MVQLEDWKNARLAGEAGKKLNATMMQC